MKRPPLPNLSLALVAGVLALSGCVPAAAPTSSEPAASIANLDLGALRERLLGEPPYPSGWETEVDGLMELLTARLEEMDIPDVSGMEPTEAACSLWRPLVGNTDWAVGALLERQFFVAETAALVAVAPEAIRQAADEALAISSEAAAEQLRSGGDPGTIARFPREAVRTIGLWAVENCDLPIEADEPPDTEGWTDAEIEQSCAWDRSWLEGAEEDYRAGPGKGSYAEHPHVLEVTLEAFVYPAWHRLARVDNATATPTFEVEPIPGGFCDR